MILKRIPVLGAIPVKRIFQIPAHLNLNTRLGTRHFRLLINSDRPGTRIVMQNKILILIDRRLQRNFRLQLPKFPPELPILQPGKRWLYGVIVFFPADFLQLDALMERIRTQIRYRSAVIPTLIPKYPQSDQSHHHNRNGCNSSPFHFQTLPLKASYILRQIHKIGASCHNHSTLFSSSMPVKLAERERT